MANQKHLRTLVDRVQPAASSVLKLKPFHDQEVRAFAANTVLNILKQNPKGNTKLIRAFSQPRTLKKLRALLHVQEWEIRIRGLHIFYYLSRVKENASKLENLREFVSIVGNLALNDPVQDIRDSAICVLQALNKYLPGVFKDHKELQSLEVSLPVIQYYALDLNFDDISQTLTLHKRSANNLDEYTALPEEDSPGFKRQTSSKTRDSSRKPDVWDAYHDRLVRIYEKYNPKKIPLIEGWMERNTHDLHSLYEKICEKYDLAPEPRVESLEDAWIRTASHNSNTSELPSSVGGGYLPWAKSPSVTKNSSFLKRTSKPTRPSARRNLFQPNPN